MEWLGTGGQGLFLGYVEGGFFFSMLKRDERGVFFLQVHKGVRVGLIK